MSDKGVSEVIQSHYGDGDNVETKYVFNFGDHDFESDLAFVALIGSWDESKKSDIDVIEYITAQKYESWIHKIRQVASAKEKVLKHTSGRWSLVDRKAAWEALASRLYKEHLDRFKEQVLIVLGELDPKFTLEPEKRFAAPIYGLEMSHSRLLRKGLAEGLAIMSTLKEMLSNCSLNYGCYVAEEVVEKTLDSGNWVLWASTQDVQPLLAEAAPDGFIDAVEKAVIHEDAPFKILYSQEGVGGISGANYMTGLLWALEKLAWSPDYILRCIVLLGEMDSHDPGGNWSNRPCNSIADILLPWHPHTTSNFQKRFASVKALEREFPKTAWKVLLGFLPSGHSTTSGTCKPQWRKFIPEGYSEGVTNEHYREQILKYTDYAVELTNDNPKRILSLVEHLDHLYEEAYTNFVTILSKYSSALDDELEKYNLWLTLLTFVNKHKKYSYTEWALSPERVQILEPILELLQPTNNMLLYKRLFAGGAMDLFEEKGGWQEQEEKLTRARNEAIKDLFDEGGYTLVMDFASTVECVSQVGNSLAQIVSEDDESQILRWMTNEDPLSSELLSGYIWSRNYLSQGSFIDELNLAEWEAQCVIDLLLLLPFETKTWDRLESLIATETRQQYWSKVNVNAYQCRDKNALYRAIDSLLAYDRPFSAIHCLYRLLYSEKTLEIEPTIKALLAAVNAEENTSRIDAHEISKLIEYIQGSESVDDDDRFRIEWAYLPLITSHRLEVRSPKFLEKRLASKPEFFCEVVRLAYVSDKEDTKPKLSDAQKNIAMNAYDLLDGWKIVPGTVEGGQFDSKLFDDWFEYVSKSTKESGHTVSAYRVLGKVLIHAPKSEDDFWIEKHLAEFVNQRGVEHVRKAYETAIYNSRGAHFVDPDGKPEIELYEQFTEKAESIDLLGMHRFSRTLRDIANHYSEQAESIVKRHSVIFQDHD